MEQGTFNKIIKIGPFVLKIPRNYNEVAKDIIKEIDSGIIHKYEKDLNKIGIKTGKVYITFLLKNKPVIIQKYISGPTIQEIANDCNISLEDKLNIFEKFLHLYKLCSEQNDIYLDWNLKNFIYHNGGIFYIDFVPVLYKNKLEKSTSYTLREYIESYLDKNIQLAGIVSYYIIPIIKNSAKNDSIFMYQRIGDLLREIIGHALNINENVEHVSICRLKIIEDYLFSNISYEEFIDKISGNTMEKKLFRVREENKK